MKQEIELNLRVYLREEGIELNVAANDNAKPIYQSLVELESIQNKPLHGHALLSEISIILKLLGKASDCKLLIDGIYQALHPHHITPRELTVLLMSLHVEILQCIRPRLNLQRATMRYIVENQDHRSNAVVTEKIIPVNEEYC